MQLIINFSFCTKRDDISQRDWKQVSFLNSVKGAFRIMPLALNAPLRKMKFFCLCGQLSFVLALPHKAKRSFRYCFASLFPNHNHKKKLPKGSFFLWCALLCDYRTCEHEDFKKLSEKIRNFI